MKVIGLISGTSVDGIDAALVEIAGTTHDLKVELLAGATYPYPAELRSQILALCAGEALTMAAFAALDDAIAYEFAKAAIAIQTHHPTAELIGSHGQTVYHRPPGLRVRGQGSGVREQGSEIENQEVSSSSHPPIPPSSSLPSPSPPSPHPPIPPSPLGYSLQLGRGDLIAALTGITTISNFRAADIALGGHGAPLVPPVDVCLLSHPTLTRCIQNIGGIGNVTYLPANSVEVLILSAQLEEPGQTLNTQNSKLKISPKETLREQNLQLHTSHATLNPSPILGWDTGPGNALLDLAVQYLSQGKTQFDQDGAWAAQGICCMPLVEQWLQHPYFHQPPPKSTGRELFGKDYLHQCLQDAVPYQLSESDLLATLTELTAASIAHSYRSFLPDLPDQVLLGGGGSRNAFLRQRLQVNLGESLVCTTDELGLNADYKEAIAFAVLAYWRVRNTPGNLPEVTGALRSTLLGEIHLATPNLRDTIRSLSGSLSESEFGAPKANY
jgi:anhydro-N-acetylmuramic acid kinase